MFGRDDSMLKGKTKIQLNIFRPTGLPCGNVSEIILKTGKAKRGQE
jgi:hypothetical protein